MGLLDIALGPMLWILFGSTLLATSMTIAVAVLKRGWPVAVFAAALPFLTASGCAALDLYYLDEMIAEEGNTLATIGPVIARALMMAMLGFAATLAPAIPAAMSAQKGPPWRWPLVPLCLIPVLALAQIPFGYPATSLIRLVPYLGVAGTLAKRGASLAILLPVVVAGESAVLAVAYVDLFASLALDAVPGIDVVSGTAREIAAGRWFGIAALIAVMIAQLLAKHWKSLISMAPLCLLFAHLADATDRIVTLVR